MPLFSAQAYGGRVIGNRAPITARYGVMNANIWFSLVKGGPGSLIRAGWGSASSSFYGWGRSVGWPNKGAHGAVRARTTMVTGHPLREVVAESANL